MLRYIMDVYTSYTIGITKKHDFYLMTHTGTLEIQFFKEIKGNMLVTVPTTPRECSKNYKRYNHYFFLQCIIPWSV